MGKTDNTTNLDALVERLLKRVPLESRPFKSDATRPINPDGPEAAEALTKLVELVKRAIGLIADAEENTNWCGGDPYGDSASEQLQQALDALGGSHD